MPHAEVVGLSVWETYEVEHGAVLVHGGGHGGGASVRILQVQQRRTAPHRFEDLGGAVRRGDHGGGLAGVLRSGKHVEGPHGGDWSDAKGGGDSRGAVRRSAGRERIGKKRMRLTLTNARARIGGDSACGRGARRAIRGGLADSDRRDRGAMIRGDASIAGPGETGSRSSRPGDERASRPRSRKARRRRPTHLAVGLDVGVRARVEELDDFVDVPVRGRSLKLRQAAEGVVVVDAHGEACEV